MRAGSSFPKFLKPEVRKHWQGSKFNKIPKHCTGRQLLKFPECWSNLIPADVLASENAARLKVSLKWENNRMEQVYQNS